MYGTTREFLERFGLNDLVDLPKVVDMSELMGFDIPLGEPTPQNALPFDSDGDRPSSDASPSDVPADTDIH
jgi:hypothetical protein